MKLKSMNKLVAQHMLGLLIDHCKGHDNPVFKPFCNTTCTYTNLTKNRIGLLKFSMIVIKNERAFFEKSIIHDLAVHVIPLLRPICHAREDLLILRIIMDRKMGRLEYVEIKGSVTGLVLPEQLGIGISGDKECSQYDQKQEQAIFHG